MKLCLFLILFGWGFPIIIPVITIAVTRDYYVDASNHCFLNTERGVIWTFIVPILTMLAINTLSLIIAIVRIIQVRSSDDQNIKKLKNNMKSALITGLTLTPVLGIPWLILIFNIAIDNTILDWIFIIINGLMGLVFFVLVVIRNKQVQGKFQRIRESYTLKQQNLQVVKNVNELGLKPIS